MSSVKTICSVCSIPIQTMGTSGVISTIAETPAAFSAADDVFWPRMTAAVTMQATATRRLSTSGMASSAPNTANAASSEVQSGEELADANVSGLTPHTPCRARFSAMAMWMYASSSA